MHSGYSNASQDRDSFSFYRRPNDLLSSAPAQLASPQHYSSPRSRSGSTPQPLHHEPQFGSSMTFINYNDDDYPSHPRDDSYAGSDYEAPYSEQR